MPRIVLLAFALLAVSASSAVAQSAAPAPDCRGVSVNDKAGDNTTTTTSEQGGPSSDIIAGWITYDETAKKAFANVQVDDLENAGIDEPYLAISWEFAMTTKDGPRYVRAYQDRTGIVKYTWGEPRPITGDQTQPRAGGPTTGQLFPGDNGVVQIEIPLNEIGAPPGTVLKGLAVETRQWMGLPAAVPSTGLPLYSYAPIFDQAAGKGTVTLGPCPSAPAPVGPSVPVPTPEVPAQLDVQVSVPKLSARKLARSKRFTVKLRGTATQLAATLTKGSRTVGTGALARLAGSGRLTVKLRGKARKGAYVLKLSGVDAAGRTAERSVKVSIRR